MIKSFIRSIWEKLKKSEIKQLAHLLPALAVVLVIVISVAATSPVVQALPDRLEYEEPEEEEEIQNPFTRHESNQEEEEADENLTVSDQVYTDGVFQGSATGYGGDVKAEVTVKSGKISKVEILEAAGETEPYFSLAKTLCDTVVKCNTWKVDVVSGATYSSKGILGAVENAITGVTVNNETAAQTLGASSSESLTSDDFSDPDAYQDGTYTGSAEGFGGTITVKVTISGGKITTIEVVDASGETPEYLSKAEGVITSIVSANSPNVDVVSGATYSSNGIINAVKRALSTAVASGKTTTDNTGSNSSEQSENQNSKNKDTVTLILPDQTITDFSTVTKSAVTYSDGTYQGTGMGFGGEIQAQITIKDGYISTVKIISAEKETPDYFNKAGAIVETMLNQQSADVDVVSGATFSSEGIMEAVQNALDQAEVKDDGENQQKEDPFADFNGNDSFKDVTVGVPVIGKYLDGTYSVSVPCNNNDDADADVYFDYVLNLNVIVENGKITAVSQSRSDDVSENPAINDKYIGYAMNGRTYKGVTYTGIANQVVEKQEADGLDVVSGATYSSNAIIEGLRDILSSALKQ